MTHECPAPGCDRQVTSSQLACRRHWFQLPRPLRNALWDTYYAPGSAAHRAAVNACCRWWDAHVAEGAS